MKELLSDCFRLGKRLVSVRHSSLQKDDAMYVLES